MDPFQAQLEAEIGDSFVDKPKTYLGDGLYAFFDGFSIILAAPRGYDLHWVALEPQMMVALTKFNQEVKRAI